jgi:hypothetical protein
MIRTQNASVKRYNRRACFSVTPRGVSALRNVHLKAGVRSESSLYISLPKDVRLGAYDIAVFQKMEGKEVGRVTRRLVRAKQERDVRKKKKINV